MTTSKWYLLLGYDMHTTLQYLENFCAIKKGIRTFILKMVNSP